MDQRPELLVENLDAVRTVEQVREVPVGGEESHVSEQFIQLFRTEVFAALKLLVIEDRGRS